MVEEYKFTKQQKTYMIRKDEEGSFTVKELNSLLEKLIKEGKEDYTVHHEGFCCGVEEIEISEIDKSISLD